MMVLQSAPEAVKGPFIDWIKTLNWTQVLQVVTEIIALFGGLPKTVDPNVHLECIKAVTNS